MARPVDNAVLMDWSPTQATVIHDNSSKRKFDEIVDTTTPFSREPVFTPQRQFYQYGDHNFYGCESHLGTIPRYGRRAAILTCAITYMVVMATLTVLGIPLGYASSSIKRRLISKTQNAAADERPTTPRRRKYRNMYLTPRQRYEQWSARSCKIRDIPGRFPGTPLTAYSRRPSPPQVESIITPQVSKLPDMSGLPGTFIESPLQMKQERLEQELSVAHGVHVYGQDYDNETPMSPYVPKRLLRSTMSAATKVPAAKSAMHKRKSVLGWPFGSRVSKTVDFYESPTTGRPITRTKRFVIGEAISHPSPNTTDESSIMSNHSPDTARHYQQLLNAQLETIPEPPPTSPFDIRATGGGLSTASEPEYPPEPEPASPRESEPESPQESEPESPQEPEPDNPQHPEPESPQESEPENARASEPKSLQESEPEDVRVPELESSKKSAPKELFNLLRKKGRTSKRRSGQRDQKSVKERIDAILKRKAEYSDPSTVSLPGHFEELQLDPRRLAERQRQVAEQEALERAAREAEERARAEREAAELQAQLAREYEADIKRRGVRRFTRNPIIQPLTPEQEDRLNRAMARGTRVTALNNLELTSRDWKTVLPPTAWLNDNIIVAYLDYVVQMAHDRVGLKRNEPPKMHAFNNNFYNNLSKSGYSGVARWARRAKIAGKALLSLEYIFIPVNASGNHWTLAVISPARRTIEYFDSLRTAGQKAKVIDHMRTWLKGELGDAYVAEEWTVRNDQGPQQGNYSDCGVHTVTTAKLVALGIDPMAAPAALMATQRRRIVAELLNSGFHGEFEADFEFV